MSALSDVLDALARAVDDASPGEVMLGEITLRPHQASAARRIRAAFVEFGGALLADEPGLGKTFTALAVARGYASCLVAAPAALRGMWRIESARARVPVRFISLEALSRGRSTPRAPLLVVDEAHHACSPGARRYAPLARLASGAHVLLLTATPVRNRRMELDALLALFLGSRAAALDDATRARCVIRRSTRWLRDVPVIQPHLIPAPRSPTVARLLHALPPPLPAADGQTAAALVTTGLARCWASSLAALERALTRRLQRGFAIRDALDAGRFPSRRELRAWVLGDDATQLALPFIVSGDATGHRGLRGVLDAHLAAVQAMRDVVRPRVAHDTRWRADHLARIRSDHAAAVVLAFTVFEATASALFSVLRHLPGVVLLTGQAARTGGGPVPRKEIIDALAPSFPSSCPDTRCFNPQLVIATDLLAEGLNLQRASAVVHLDQPWTPAGLAQRVGRAARLGSTHAFVEEHEFVAPQGAERLLRTHALHRVKRRSARRALEASDAREALRESCSGWFSDQPAAPPAVTAATHASVAGFIARLEAPARAFLVASSPRFAARSRPVWTATDDPVAILQLVRAVRPGHRAPPRRSEIADATAALIRWMDRRRSAVSAGVGCSPAPSVRGALARLDSVLDRTPPSLRPNVGARIGRLRAMLLAARGVAVEHHVRSILKRPADAPGWLDDLESGLRDALSIEGPGGERPAIAAILILRVREADVHGPSPEPLPPVRAP